MVFSSMFFLSVFLPIVFLLYYLVPGIKAKNGLLIVFSLFFYAYGEPIYVLLMIFSTIMNYLFGRLLAGDNQTKRKMVLFVAVVMNLGMLGVFKYTDMIIETLNQLLSLNIAPVYLELPIGISFYTFQAMSYVIDVYRKEVQIQNNYFHVLLYVSFFPQLIAGPIVKYHDIQEQMDQRQADITQIANGFQRFVIGLSKKVLISNSVGVAVDAIFALELSQLNMLSAWIGALAYLMQIYFDFSGYSDMAIGLGQMFGFHFLENFNYPYIAASIKEFWRRWHISLSTWFKEYLYIHLGGNRKGKGRTLLNKTLVFFCTGLWHGASWTFVVWGLWHGLFQILEELLPIHKLPKILGHIYTLLVVILGFVLFRADSFEQGLILIKNLFVGFNLSGLPLTFAMEQLTPTFILAIIIGIIASCPVLPWLQGKLPNNTTVKTVWGASGKIISLCLLILCILSLSSGTYNPFIYFRF
ncbi:alginate O-acetyltransferase complex protein AlgI [Enterococcus sp. PF1-24]|uniref:MBOAT family O-acyltransferase n=1 Tax=unclassified Enterococcus TaxID=2608891 RepID=UPI002475631C|nr:MULTISPECIES: MBOAT family O-acyltransferase [unclassified Enterococcus]MDH6365290.1 alginate O-acetyltransferase complex protein AlgI [Enterococcus sp. PFB1-1]MDH6402380.1 alginate O-acetyltransferase complex protein AlgI [Enterococcus sp. PF1-24]